MVIKPEIQLSYFVIYELSTFFLAGPLNKSPNLRLAVIYDFHLVIIWNN